MQHFLFLAFMDARHSANLGINKHTYIIAVHEIKEGQQSKGHAPALSVIFITSAPRHVPSQAP
jgi:hypothetical protein